MRTPVRLPDEVSAHSKNAGVRAPVRLPDHELAAMLHLPTCQVWCNEYVVYTTDGNVLIDCACNGRAWIREGGAIPNGRGTAPQTDPNSDRVLITPLIYDPSKLEPIR